MIPGILASQVTVAPVIISCDYPFVYAPLAAYGYAEPTMSNGNQTAAVALPAGINQHGAVTYPETVPLDTGDKVIRLGLDAMYRVANDGTEGSIAGNLKFLTAGLATQAILSLASMNSGYNPRVYDSSNTIVGGYTSGEVKPNFLDIRFRAAAGVFDAFSSDGVPLTINRAYTPQAMLALLEVVSDSIAGAAIGTTVQLSAITDATTLANSQWADSGATDICGNAIVTNSSNTFAYPLDALSAEVIAGGFGDARLVMRDNNTVGEYAVQSALGATFTAAAVPAGAGTTGQTLSLGTGNKVIQAILAVPEITGGTGNGVTSTVSVMNSAMSALRIRATLKVTNDTVFSLTITNHTGTIFSGPSFNLCRLSFEFKSDGTMEIRRDNTLLTLTNNTYVTGAAVAFAEVAEYANVPAGAAGLLARAELIANAGKMRGTITAGFTDDGGTAP